MLPEINKYPLVIGVLSCTESMALFITIHLRAGGNASVPILHDCNQSVTEISAAFCQLSQKSHIEGRELFLAKSLLAGMAL